VTHPWKIEGIGFIGAGAVGSALARGLRSLGYHVVAVASRNPKSARALAAQFPGCRAVGGAQAVADACAAVFITTPDAAIAGVVDGVRWRRAQDVLHCSGAAPVALLAQARRAGANIGALHPLQTFPHRNVTEDALHGITFGVQADGPLLDRLESLVAELGSRAIHLRDEDRPLYHASAVLVCGAATALAGVAADLWRTLAEPRSHEDGLQALLPLLRGTLDQLAARGLPEALTGPVARGDVATVQAQINALEQRSPEAVRVYTALGLVQVPIARQKGGCTDRAARELTELFSDAFVAERTVTARRRPA